MTKTTQELVADAAAKHGLTPQQILGHSRRRDIVRARWEAWRAASEQGWTLSKIASEFNRDHTTILHGLQKGGSDMNDEMELTRFVAHIEYTDNQADQTLEDYQDVRYDSAWVRFIWEDEMLTIPMHRIKSISEKSYSE